MVGLFTHLLLLEVLAGLGQARWRLVDHPGYKIFKIKLVTTYLRYKPSWCEGFGHFLLGRERKLGSLILVLKLMF